MKDARISIIIPNYNGIDLLRVNVPMVLAAAANKTNMVMEVIVVDDGSIDGSVQFLKSTFPEVRTIKHTVNRGFSAAVNTGVRMAKGNFVVLINSDVYPSRDFLKKTLKLFDEYDNLFAVSFHEKGYGWAKGSFDGYIIHKPGHEDKTPHPTFFVNAGGAIYKKEIWKKLGGMDELLYSPFYWEDVDLSYRALKRGYELMWDPSAIVSPNISATVRKLNKKKVVRVQERNHLLFVWKNLTSKALARKHIAALLRRIIRHPGYLRIVFMALSKWKIVMRKRKKEAEESSVSDEAIFQKFQAR